MEHQFSKIFGNFSLKRYNGRQFPQRGEPESQYNWRKYWKKNEAKRSRWSFNGGTGAPPLATNHFRSLFFFIPAFVIGVKVSRTSLRVLYEVVTASTTLYVLVLKFSNKTNNSSAKNNDEMRTFSVLKVYFKNERFQYWMKGVFWSFWRHCELYSHEKTDTVKLYGLFSGFPHDI